jgi:NAD(P)H-hydrate epimerase
VAVPQGISAVVSAFEPSYLTAALVEDQEGKVSPAASSALLELARRNNVLAIGPGLGQGAGVSYVVRSLLGGVRKPTVLDADGLNALAEQPDCVNSLGPLAILTPHPGEFARLTRTTSEGVQANREQLAIQFSRRHRCIVVLKGYRTVVTDGERVRLNDTGNPGMATGGSGDVLTGLIAALLGQGLSSFEAAVLGAHVHGLAGDLAARELGQTALIASDLLRFLPAALRTVERR